jgi:hypothetical protein
MTTNDDATLATDITSLLRSANSAGRDLANWDRGDFLHERGSTLGALTYSVLFAPAFVEIEGFVFITDLTPGPAGGAEEIAVQLRAARAKSDEDLRNLLASYNWMEVPYLFGNNRGSDLEVSTLARAVADAWRARLRGLYPDRHFEVRVVPEGETGGEIGVGFVELSVQSPS